MAKTSIIKAAIGMCLLFATSHAFSDEPFRGTFAGTDFKIQIDIDLYEENVKVPGMEAFGPMNGYMKGTDLYCTWYVSSVREVGQDKALVHFSNELGSETQPVELTLQGDSLLQLKQVKGNWLKKVVGKKLQKLPTELTFKRTK